MSTHPYCLFFFFFNDTATTEIYTLSLHDALPICRGELLAEGGRERIELGREVVGNDAGEVGRGVGRGVDVELRQHRALIDRKSTRLNSSHSQISYAVFCLKKKKTSKQAKNTNSE